MRKVYLLMLVLLVSLAFLSFPACSDDKSGTNPDEEVNTNEQAFLNDVIGDGLATSPIQTFQLAFALIDNIPNGSSKMSSVITSTLGELSEDIVIDAIGKYDYINGWHVFEFEATIIDSENKDTLDIDGVDSIQVLVDGLAVEDVIDDDEIDGVKAREHINVNVRGGIGQGRIDNVLDLIVNAMATDTIIAIDGVGKESFIGVENSDTANCDLDVTALMQIENVKISTLADEEDCPLSGKIIATVTLNANCIGKGDASFDSSSFSGTWTVTATVNDDNSVTVKFSGGGFTWTVTEGCDDSGVNTSGWWLTRSR